MSWDLFAIEGTSSPEVTVESCLDDEPEEGLLVPATDVGTLPEREAGGYDGARLVGTIGVGGMGWSVYDAAGPAVTQKTLGQGPGGATAVYRDAKGSFRRLPPWEAMRTHSFPEAFVQWLRVDKGADWVHGHTGRPRTGGGHGPGRSHVAARDRTTATEPSWRLIPRRGFCEFQLICRWQFPCKSFERTRPRPGVSPRRPWLRGAFRGAGGRGTAARRIGRCNNNAGPAFMAGVSCPGLNTPLRWCARMLSRRGAENAQNPHKTPPAARSFLDGFFLASARVRALDGRSVELR